MLICLAPMDGITDIAYRLICKDIFDIYGKKEDTLMMWTEFVSADGYHHNPPGVVRHLLQADTEPETIAQIFGGNADTLLECAVDIQKKYNFGGIELNMGCPSPKIMKCAAGSGMLKDKKKTLDILAQISKEMTVPFSLKTRIGLSQDDVVEQFDFLVEASKYVGLIAVHGRTYGQSHAGFVDRDFIYRLKQTCPDTIVIGNGGLRSYNDAVNRLSPRNPPNPLGERGSSTILPFDKGGLEEICLDGNMIAQSAIGNPWVMTPHIPTVEDRFDVIYKHLDMICACEIWFKKHIEIYTHTDGLIQPTRAELDVICMKLSTNEDQIEGIYVHELHAPVEFRKFLFNYVSGLPDSKALKKQIPPCRDYASLKVLLQEYEVQVRD